MPRSSPDQRAPAALAVAAHPDDIEFVMAGTLLLLRRAGWEIHYLNVSRGNCGSVEFKPDRARRVRREESKRAAEVLGATWHPPFCDDLEIVYSVPLLRRLASVIRAVRPAVVLTHSPLDYMEDHTNTCRLAVTAAFARGMPNFRVTPARGAVEGDVTVYHAMPHGLCGPLGEPIVPTHVVDTAAVHAIKRQALAAHASQKAWLDRSQGMDSYLVAMDDMSRDVARFARGVTLAEGWRRHMHLGFCGADTDPLRDVLGKDCRMRQGSRATTQKKSS